MLPVAGLIDGLFDSNTTGWAIVGVQAALSVGMLAAIISKMRHVLSVASVSRRFRRDFNTGNNVLSYYMQRRRDCHAPMEAIYRMSCERLLKILAPEARSKMYEGALIPEGSALSPREVALVNATCEQTLEEQELALDTGMGLVATVVTLAPMLGLLGTVWGVLDAFGDMEPGAAMMQKLAPSISSALVTTVIGLIVAIPGVIAYNWLSAKIRRIDSEMESFADELCGRIACEFQGRDS
jgi:biopolymer transport protein TolQ